MSWGPVRALALKHPPALLKLQTYFEDADWDDMNCIAEQMAIGYMFSQEVDDEKGSAQTKDTENGSYRTLEAYATHDQTQLSPPDAIEGPRQ